jgi:DNA-binding XRE family transcriptional regulator
MTKVKKESKKDKIRLKLEKLKFDRPKTFSQKLRYYRIKNDLTQKELGRVLNVSKMTIHRYETNKTVPAHQTIDKIERLFKISEFIS